MIDAGADEATLDFYPKRGCTVVNNPASPLRAPGTNWLRRG
ncbi:MAG: hypothetical protein ACUVS4_13180 [Chloroflexaceae bacterium]